MDYTNLILALIGAVPGLVTALENFFKSFPRLDGETDEAYATRVNAATLKLAQDTTQADNQVSSTPAS